MENDIKTCYLRLVQIILWNSGWLLTFKSEKSIILHIKKCQAYVMTNAFTEKDSPRDIVWTSESLLLFCWGFAWLLLNVNVWIIHQDKINSCRFIDEIFKISLQCLCLFTDPNLDFPNRFNQIKINWVY